MSPVRRTAIASAVAVATVTALAVPALAAAVTRVTGTTTTTAATFGAAAGPSAGPAGTGSSYVLSYPGGAIVPRYFRVFNTGTLALQGHSSFAVNSKPSGNAPPAIALDACVGADWNTLLGTCTGTVVPLTTTDATVPTAVTLALAVGANVHVRAANTKLPNFPQAFTTTVTITVARAQATAGTTRTS